MTTERYTALTAAYALLLDLPATTEEGFGLVERVCNRVEDAMFEGHEA